MWFLNTRGVSVDEMNSHILYIVYAVDKNQTYKCTWVEVAVQ